MKIIYSDIFPKDLVVDALYVSREYSTTAHMCASECGLRVVLPLGKGYWELMDEVNATLHPSVHVPSCNSHYWIESGTIRWSKQMSPTESQEYSQIDQQLHDREIAPQQSLFKRIVSSILQLFKH